MSPPQGSQRSESRAITCQKWQLKHLQLCCVGGISVKEREEQEIIICRSYIYSVPVLSCGDANNDDGVDDLVQLT